MYSCATASKHCLIISPDWICQRCFSLTLARCLQFQKSQRLRGESFRSESTFVGVVDNLLCIFLRELKSTMFLDIPSLFSDDSRELTELIESQRNDTRIYDGRWVNSSSFNFAHNSSFNSHMSLSESIAYHF